MGYRIRLGRVAKSDWEKVKELSIEEVDSLCEKGKKDEGLYGISYPPFHTEIYELGKGVDFPEHRSNFYKFDNDEDWEFDILSKEGLAKIIRHYEDTTSEFMNEMLAYASLLLDDGDKKDKEILEYLIKNVGVKMSGLYKEDAARKIVSFFFGMQQEWTNGRKYGRIPYYLNEPADQKDGDLIRSWKQQYNVLNLVYIYHTFDWDNDLLIISGW